MKMCDIALGHDVAVISVGGEGRERSRLLDLGFVRGTKVKAIGSAPGGDPMEFSLRGYNVILRRSTAALVEAEPCGKERTR